MDTATAQDLNIAIDGVEAASVPMSRERPRLSPLKLAMAVLAGLLLVVSVAWLILIQLGYPRLQGVIATSLIKHSNEQAYTAQLPQPQPQTWGGLFSFAADSVDEPRVSTLQVFEDGVAIGPPHTAHREIARGGGAFSHWGEHLYFSSTRGDDPRTNGREYRIVAAYTPAPWLVPALAVLACLTGGLLLGLTLGGSTFAILNRFAPPAIYAVTVAGLVVVAVLSLVDVPQVYTLEPSSIRAGRGHSYEAQFPAEQSAIPFLEPIKANRNSTTAPAVRLLENGEETGMAQSAARLVESIGEGRYVATGSRILFSTVDNSDPRTNSNSYAVRQRLALSPGAGAVVMLLIMASLILIARKRARLVLGGLSGAAMALGVLGVLTYFDIITHDEYVSPAGVYHVIDGAYGFSIRGSVAPFVSAAPVGAPTAVGVGDILVNCESKPTSASELSRDGSGACSRRATGIDVDIVFPESAGEDAAPRFYRYPVRVHWYAVVGLFLVGAILMLALWFRPTARLALVGTGALIGGVGAFLMAANLSGPLFDLRAPMPTEPVQGIRSDTPRLPFDESVRRLTWRQDDNSESYARRANQVVFESMIHGDVSTDLGRWRLEIPIWENWSLHALGAVEPNFTKYRYWDHKKELERGIGVCGNLSAVLIGYLVENGVPARSVGLSGHVVVTAEMRPGVWYILDPDYGVVIPHSLDEVQANPDLAKSAYRDAAGAEEVRLIVGYYATAADNSIDQSGRDGAFNGPDGSAEIYRAREKFLEWLKWSAPSLMLAAGLVIGLGAYLIPGRRRKRSGQVTGSAIEPAAPAGLS